MRSIIIIRGLVKSEKQGWIKKEGLENFLIDINNLREMFYRPEYHNGSDIIVRSREETVYKLFMQAIISRLSTGCLAVIDADRESTSSIEELAIIFGYKVYYKYCTAGVKEFFSNPLRHIKYNTDQPFYKTIRSAREFTKEDRTGKTLIDSYKDIKNSLGIQKVRGDILFISDIHSNHKLFKKVLGDVEYDYVVCLGDYIDGPEKGGSRRMLDFILNYPNPDMIFLEGNHELRLRKFLGLLHMKASKKKTLAQILESYIPQDFIDRTADEFSSISEPLEYLKRINKNLKEFVVLENNGARLYCSHAGLISPNILSPKYVGNVISNCENPNTIDSTWSRNETDLSIHGHCKYPEGIRFRKFKKVINIDTENDGVINYFINPENICTIARQDKLV